MNSKIPFTITFSFLIAVNIFAQKPISVHELETKYNTDWWELGAVLVDTFQVNPFTELYIFIMFMNLLVQKENMK